MPWTCSHILGETNGEAEQQLTAGLMAKSSLPKVDFRQLQHGMKEIYLLTSANVQTVVSLTFTKTDHHILQWCGPSCWPS